MKLILAHNQTQPFIDFYEAMNQRSRSGLRYVGYQSLLFSVCCQQDQSVVITLDDGTAITDFDGVYINGYLDNIELATAVALFCENNGLPYVNQELGNAASYSKLTSYVKLAAAGLPLPATIAGSPQALMQLTQAATATLFPAVLKRADADRGLDNFKVMNLPEAKKLLTDQPAETVWLLQEFVPNDGFYTVNFYGGEAKFSIFRSLQARPDKNSQKAHMFKPRGGRNAQLLSIADLPEPVVALASQAMRAMNRQIGSVDCLYDAATATTHILEVNYNPQLVTIETFKAARTAAFLEFFDSDWKV